MTNTALDIEIEICNCCRMVVANSDDSGCETPELKEEGRLASEWARSHRIVVLDGEGRDTGWNFTPDSCNLCGRSGCSDMLLFPALAMHES